jgi:hypothetical protein
MAVFDSCCYKWSTKTGSIVIGTLLLVFSVCFLIVTIGLVAAWEDFDTQFLDDRLSRLVGYALIHDKKNAFIIFARRSLSVFWPVTIQKCSKVFSK